MDVYTDTIRNMAAADKLLLVERIWDDLAAEEAPLPLPNWAVAEAARRRDELLADPELGLTHKEVWKRIGDSRNG
ncbi:addiction module protein [Stieleria sp. TO1_6]|uniref:addiction module protein n=1 Tax=Stieleria tagensis TaxID=2956795 RepID=UPI00209B8FD1|nr:addiction module protein [Stieleria tagensis]MCO8123042.1 addiction module protein [Stieleria tagensis]